MFLLALPFNVCRFVADFSNICLTSKAGGCSVLFMNATKFSQNIIDRANEWLSEHYPELDVPEYDAKLLEVCSEIANIDAARDAE